MADSKPEFTDRQPSWFSALSPAGRGWAVLVGIFICALVAWAAFLAITATSTMKAASVSALISSVASLVALFVAASTAGARRLDAIHEDRAQHVDAVRRASLLRCAVTINESGDRPTAFITLTNYGASTFTDIDCLLAGRNIVQVDDAGHVETRNPRALSAFRDWRDAPIGSTDTPAMQRVQQGFLGPLVTALGPSGQITVEVDLPPLLGAQFQALKPIYEFTDLDGARWEREGENTRTASEFDENGKHRWFRKPITPTRGQWECEK